MSVLIVYVIVYDDNIKFCEVVHDVPRFLVNYTHVQTVGTRPTFVCGGRSMQLLLAIWKNVLEW